MENEFLKKLKEWLDKVNNNENIKNIILEKNFFARDNDGNYYIDENNEKELEVLLKSQVCFIGDNPGKNEIENYQYFNKDNQDKRTAGYKINKVLNEFNVNSFFYFNKCLIGTNRTRDLSLKNIESTKTLVCDFLNLINLHNPNLIFIFLGLNKKFLKIYKIVGCFFFDCEQMGNWKV